MKANGKICLLTYYKWNAHVYKNEGTDMGLKSAVAALELCLQRASPAGVCLIFLLKALWKEIQQ